MKSILKLLPGTILALVLAVQTGNASTYLINVDLIGNATTTSRTGAAVVGTGPSDYWSSYTCDDGSGGGLQIHGLLRSRIPRLWQWLEFSAQESSRSGVYLDEDAG